MAESLQDHEESESIFTSVADLLVGFLFVFLILLTYFALQYKDAASTILNQDDARLSIVQPSPPRVVNPELPVDIEPPLGQLLLPEAVLFSKGSSELSPEGQRVIADVAASVRDLLRCQLGISADCELGWGVVDSILIEGGTDAEEVEASNDYGGNWDLSISRAFSVYRAMVAMEPALANARSGASSRRPLFGVTGRGARPFDSLSAGSRKVDLANNRRIEFQILMRQPPKK